MAGDFNKPSGSSLRTAFMQEIRDMFASLAKMDGASANPPTGHVRFNSTTKRFEYWTGSAWAACDISETTIALAANATNHGGSSLANVLARANHTGTQAIATLSDHNKAAHDALGIAAASCAGNAATATTANNLSMTGEASNYSNVLETPAVVNLGSVKAGDRIFVTGFGRWSPGTTGIHGMSLSKSGTCTGKFGNITGSPSANPANTHYALSGYNSAHIITTVYVVTGDGTLTLSFYAGTYTGTPTSVEQSIYAYFLFKG